MSTAGCARNFIAAWCPRIPASRRAARSTRSMSPRINRTSCRSFPIPKSTTASWCSRKPTRSMSRASRRSAGPRKSGLSENRRKIPGSRQNISEASVMHPLPRVNELDASFDSDRRAVYFQQAAYGVPIRMALISLLLHLHKNKSLRQIRRRLRQARSSDLCPADRHRPAMRQSELHHRRSGRTAICRQQVLCRRRGLAAALHAALRLLREGRRRRQPTRISSSPIRRGRPFAPDLAALAGASADKLKHVVIYRDEADALAAGFTPREPRQKGPRRLGDVALSSAVPTSGNIPPPCCIPSNDIAAFLFGYLCGSIPFGCADHAARRRARRALHRLRQYRRHQRLAHRPQRPRRGDACSATCSRALPRSRSPRILRRARLRSSPRLAPFSATVSGLARL